MIRFVFVCKGCKGEFFPDEENNSTIIFDFNKEEVQFHCSKCGHMNIFNMSDKGFANRKPFPKISAR